MSPASTRETIHRLGPWFHNLHLPGDVETAPDHPLGDFPAFKWRQFRHFLPADLSGWTALDAGCNAGFYSFELARRGASVLAVDTDPHYLAQARWAAEQMDLPGTVELRQMQVYELAHLEQSFDLVLFLGVFYHLRYPLLGLDTLVRRTRRLLVFQALTMPGEEVEEETWRDRPIHERDVFLRPGWPKMAFIEHTFAADPTNWWIPNRSGVEALLRSAGLEVLERPDREIYLCRPTGRLREPAHEAEYLAATGSYRPRITGRRS